MTHVFISYRHGADSEYVDQLARHLTEAGIPVWYDRELVTGDRWDQVIQQRLDACRAVVVVMSPAARESPWVNREIQRAEDQGKPIFPVLRAGEKFFRLGELQHEDVRDGRPPSRSFLARLGAEQQSGVTVRYRISRRFKEVQIEVTATRDCTDVDLVVVVSPGAIMPLEPADGAAAHRFTRLSLRAGAPKRLRVPDVGNVVKPYWIRCFATAPAGLLVEDPAVDDMLSA